MTQPEERGGLDPLACPKCGHVRLATDRTPLSQCAGCGVVFSKYVPKDSRIRIYAGVEAENGLAPERLTIPSPVAIGIAAVLVASSAVCVYFGLSGWEKSNSIDRIPSILLLLLGGGALVVAALVLLLARGSFSRAVGWLGGLLLGTVGK
jgi:hypothetical protein